MESLNEVLGLLELEEIDVNLYRGQSYITPWKRVFGGQVLGQSLAAAYKTVPENRLAHSMHAYFILPGDVDIPIIYEVDTIRDGGSFTTRRVVAKQRGRAIFNMAASFQLNQKGVEHQIPMPEAGDPEDLKSIEEQLRFLELLSPKVYKKLLGIHPNAIEFRPYNNPYKLPPRNFDPEMKVWFRLKEKSKIDIPKQHQLLAYASDFGLLRTATLPHQTKLMLKKTLFASLDHAMWFHADFDLCEWLLFATDSPSASNSRGFTRGSIFNQKGKLISSVCQEGLIRIKDWL